MRPPGPPLRFLIAVVALWIGARAAILTRPDGVEAVEAADAPQAAAPMAAALPPRAIPAMATGVIPTDGVTALPVAQGRRNGVAAVAARGASASVRIAHADQALDGAAIPPSPLPPAAPTPQFPGAARAAPPVALAAAGPAARRWSGSVFLFGRDGGGAVPLAGGGQLGASQAGARIAYRIDDAGRIAAAARVYAPIDTVSGSEAAVGIDLHPLPGAPLRISVERRIALGRQGRDAWSAYAAGGFFKGIGRSIELDGYAQAGIVGVRSRDLFADGALRAARRFDLGGNRAVLAGAGAWGAAQPGVERVDIGPRVALRLPAGPAAISIAGEWRARIAGSARPGSGPALTIAADF